MVRFLIWIGADVNGKDTTGKTSVHYAVQNGHINVVNILHKHGANLNVQDSRGHNIGHVVAKYDQYRIIQQLVTLGTKMNVKNKDSQYPIHVAASKNHHETVRILAQLKITDLNVLENQGQTPLMICAKYGYTKAATELLRHTSKPNLVFQSEKGITALHTAAHAGQTDIVTFGANVDTENEGGWTPLMYAAGQGHDNATAALLRDAKPPQKSRALFTASCKGHDKYNVVQTLLDHDTNINRKDTRG